MENILVGIAGVAGVAIPIIILAIVLVKVCWKVAGTNEVLIVSGLGKVKRKTGGGVFVIPLLQRTQKMTLENIQVDFTSRNEIPTKDAIHVLVDAVANMSISLEPDKQEIAASKFAGYSVAQIREIVIPVLEGNIREIISQTLFEDLIRGDKKVFAEKIQENVTPNLADLGINLTTFNIQNFSDRNGVIQDLGVDNIEKIRKEASIAAAKAKAEVAIAQAEAEKQANDARVKAAEEIATRNNDLAIRQAELKRESDAKKAQADAAMDIEAENQNKLKNIAATDAEIAKAEREAELKRKEIELREYELTALVHKQADADKYAAEKAAEAELIARQREAEAKRYEQEQKAAADKYAAEQEAEAMRAKADAAKYAAMAEAEGIAAVGKAEAEAIQAKALAEAEGIDKKAEAQKKMGEASVMEMYFEALPKVVANASAPLTNVDKITLYGEGNQAKLVGDVMKSADQIMSALTESTGVDIKSAVAGFLGGKAAK